MCGRPHLITPGLLVQLLERWLAVRSVGKPFALAQIRDFATFLQKRGVEKK